MSQNRVVVGLPERYEKAKVALSKLEKRQKLIKGTALFTEDSEEALEKIIMILEGQFDD